MKSRRRHPDDRERHAVDCHSLAERPRHVAETALRETVGDYRDRRRALALVIDPDQPARGWSKPEHAEEPAGDVQAIDGAPLIANQRGHPAKRC